MKHELGLYLFAVARMQDCSVELLVPTPVGVKRGQTIAEELLEDGWTPDVLQRQPIFTWTPLDRYLTFIGQAYADTLSGAALPPGERTFYAVVEAESTDLIRYAFQPDPPLLFNC